MRQYVNAWIPREWMPLLPIIHLVATQDNLSDKLFLWLCSMERSPLVLLMSWFILTSMTHIHLQGFNEARSSNARKILLEGPRDLPSRYDPAVNNVHVLCAPHHLQDQDMTEQNVNKCYPCRKSVMIFNNEWSKSVIRSRMIVLSEVMIEVVHNQTIRKYLGTCTLLITGRWVLINFPGDQEDWFLKAKMIRWFILLVKMMETRLKSILHNILSGRIRRTIVPSI